MYGTESSQLDVAPKLRVIFQGPYLVLATLGELEYRIQCGAMGKHKVMHHDKFARGNVQT